MPFNPVLPKFESTPGPINPIPDSRKDCVYTYWQVDFQYSYRDK